MPSARVPSLPPAARASWPRVGMGLLFYPRGGSAFVVRELLPRLASLGWPVRLFVGSLGAPGAPTHAGTFFRGLDVWPHDYTGAIEAFARGADSLSRPVPMHPSYEDRLDAPDPIFTSVPPELLEPQVRAWQRTFAAGGMGRCEVAHLHHLTPQADAVRRSWPHLPIVGHLHGTELKMLAELERRCGLARDLGTDLAGVARSTGPAGARGEVLPRWEQRRHSGFWREYLRGIARRYARIVVVSSADAEEAVRLLPVRPEQLVVVPNAVDTERFDRRRFGVADRLSRWRRWLVTEPLGWDESGVPGSVRYREADLAAFVDPSTGQVRPVVMFVGRFTAVKRLNLLLCAYARVRKLRGPLAPLVVWGGSPGEWEGEHPVTQVRRLGIDGVFFVGHRGHEDLPAGLACADVLAVPSVRESFGQVYLEAMASGLPVIATRSGGPPSFINVVPGRPTGWLVEPDDEDDLAVALEQALGDPSVRVARGQEAYLQIRARFSWEACAARLAQIYETVRRR
ncbi:MAG: glycosyltransferase family 4 protein [Frankiaceae bacterium]